MNQELARTLIADTYNYPAVTAALNMLLAFVLGLGVSYIYRITHTGLSYSQSFVLTIIYLTVITSSVIMIIGNSLTMAFALVGALSIIRFRTVVKDTKDTAYIFLALAGGMACGTSNYFLAIFTVVFTCTIVWLLFRFNYGMLSESEFILRFYYPVNGEESSYLNIIRDMTKSNSLLHVEPTGDGKQNYVTYGISMDEDKKANDLLAKLTQVNNIEELVLVSSKSDINY